MQYGGAGNDILFGDDKALWKLLGKAVTDKKRVNREDPGNPDDCPTIAVMPMTTPSTVRPERILLALMVPRAIPIVSAKSARRTAMGATRQEPGVRIENRELRIGLLAT